MKKKTLLLAAAIASIVVGAALAATIIGQISMPWTITSPPPPPPTATMSPSVITIDMGSLATGETKSVDPAKVAVLTVANGALDINTLLGGEYGGFDALSIAIQLKQGGDVKYQTTLEPTIVVSNTLNLGPTGWGGWSDKTASAKGEVVTCFVRKISGEGDWAKLVKWAPGSSVDSISYPNTPFGYTYDSSIPETGYLIQNDNDPGEKLQLVLVYPPTSTVISGVVPGTYDVCVGYSVTAGSTPSSGVATVTFSIP